MVEKLWQTPEIWRLEIPLPQNPLRALMSYVVRDQGEVMVIDTGFNRPECEQALLEGLAELGLTPGQCTLFLTHLHSDHIGLAEIFAKAGAPIYMSQIDHEYFCGNKQGDNWAYMEDWFAREGFPQEEIAKQANGNQARIYAPSAVFPVTPVTDGQCLQLGRLTFRCIHTPGHSPGHICLYLEKEQILFSGDHVLFDITPNITVWRTMPNSLEKYIESVNKLMDLPVVMTFPAHRATNADLQSRLHSLLTHHQHRLEEIEAAAKSQPGLSAYDIAGRIQWSARGLPWEKFPPNQKWFAMGETLAHLVHLRNLGRL